MEPIINDTTAFLIKFKKQKFGSRLSHDHFQMEIEKNKKNLLYH
jgi:hypothetical protein